MQHTLLNRPGFNELRKIMWVDERETDLIKLLGTFALVVRIFKFFLAIDELYQFRYLNEVEAIDEGDADIIHEGAEAEDGW